MNSCSVIFGECGGLRILCQRFLQPGTDMGVIVLLICVVSFLLKSLHLHGIFENTFC